MQAHRRAGLPHGQVDEARGDLRAGRGVVAVVDGHGDHGADRGARVDGLATGEQPRAERTGDGGEDDVVDRHLVGEGATAQAGADLAVVLEVGADHDVAAGPADRRVERRLGGRPCRDAGQGRDDVGGDGRHLPDRVGDVGDAVLDRLDDLARGARRLGERRDDELGTARLGAGPPRGEHSLAGRGVAVDQDVADVDRADAVDEAVVGLGDDGEAVLGQALDEVDLPHRAGAVERARLDAGDELLELLVGARAGQGAAAHVVAHVEVACRRPTPGSRGRPAPS